MMDLNERIKAFEMFSRAGYVHMHADAYNPAIESMGFTLGRDILRDILETESLSYVMEDKIKRFLEADTQP